MIDNEFGIKYNEGCIEGDVNMITAAIGAAVMIPQNENLTIAKALKYKKRVIQRISELTSEIRDFNSVVKGQGDLESIDTNQSIADRADLVEHLVQLKYAIVRANVENAEIQQGIFRLSELKSWVSTLESLDTKHGKQSPLYGDAEIECIATIRRVDKIARIRQTEREIDEIQEKLEAFNAITRITVPGLGILDRTNTGTAPNL